MPEIQRISHKHDAIMNYMLANPNIPLSIVALEFSVSQPWLSCIIHSDIFQAQMREKQGAIFHHTMIPLREKLTFVANQTMDRLIERLPLENDVSTLSKTAEGVLDRLGFGSKTPGGNTFIFGQTNNTQVNTLKEELEDARKLIGTAARPTIGVVIDESGKQLTLSNEGQTNLGSDDSRRTLTIQTGAGDEQATEEGAET